MYGAFRTFGSSAQNADFPVWCPENSKVDSSLLVSSLPQTAGMSTIYQIDASHPAILPILSIGDLTTGWDFICEDL
jgi:hypothetical protein